MQQDERTELSNIIRKRRITYTKGAELWSFTHHFFIWGATCLSTVAALILLLKDNPKLDDTDLYAAIMTSLAAAMTAISASGSFGRKWRANRLSRSRFEQIEVNLTNPAATGDMLREDINRAIDLHHQGIAGESD